MKLFQGVSKLKDMVSGIFKKATTKSYSMAEQKEKEREYGRKAFQKRKKKQKSARDARKKNQQIRKHKKNNKGRGKK